MRTQAHPEQDEAGRLPATGGSARNRAKHKTHPNTNKKEKGSRLSFQFGENRRHLPGEAVQLLQRKLELAQLGSENLLLVAGRGQDFAEGEKEVLEFG